MKNYPYDCWYEQPWLLVDTETTGVNATDRVIQLGLARYERGKLVDSWGTLLFAGVEIPEEATRIHGISTAATAAAPSWTYVIPQVAKLGRDAMPVAYNADFDKRMFLSEMGRLAARLHETIIPVFRPDVRWGDPLIWVRHFDRFVKGEGRHKLFRTCERRGITLTKAHDAISDCTAAGRLFWEMRHEIGDMTESEMMRQQQILGAAQERRRLAWLARQDRQRRAQR